MKEKTITVLVRKPWQEPTLETVENSLKTMQGLVGGLIEMPGNPEFSEGLQIVCDEEGKYRDEPQPNVKWGDYDTIFGTIVFVGIGEEGEDKSLTEAQIAEAKAWIAKNKIAPVTLAESEILTKINEICRRMGLPVGDCIQKTYYAAESGKLRIIVRGNRFEANYDGSIKWKP